MDNGAILGFFGPFFGPTRIFPIKPPVSVLSIYQLSTSCKISKKSNERILRKIHNYAKLSNFGPFWSIFGPTRIFFKNWALSLFSTYQPLTSCKISKKSNEPILRKLGCKNWPDGQTDGQTDRYEIIGPSQSVGPKKRRKKENIEQPL